MITVGVDLYSYNSGGYLTAVTEPGGSGCTSYNTTTALPASGSRCIATLMNENNQPKQVAYPGGVVKTTHYMQSGKIDSIKVVKGTTTDEDLSPSYFDSTSGDETDLLQSRTDNQPSPDITTTYDYDGLNRLTTANNVITNIGSPGFTATTRNESWKYDTEGNITQAVVGTTTNFAYNDADELCYSGTTTNPT